MFMKQCAVRVAVLTLFFVIPGVTNFAQTSVAELGSALRWRSIGPHRGGRTRAISGVPSQPNVFYMAPNNGGVWKTTDAGRVWLPIFDDQPTGSVGALAVADSDPNVIYVGSGEGLHRPDLSIGDGIFKSTDAGKTWTHLDQLRDAQQIAEIVIDPKDANKLLVAVAGHPFGPNAERGIYRSTNGGRSFDMVLGKDENTGGWDIVFDPTNANIVYASLWESREGPWENGRWDGTGAGIFKSTDGGATWRQLTAGLPNGITQASLAVAPSNTKRLFAAVRTPESTKFYRSDDAGESWSYVETDTRPTNRIASGDLGDIQFDPKNADVLYVASIVTWRSTDVGKTWTAFRGAPGGDDYQNIWINPADGNVMAVASDQGAIITLNGGRSWSSWYNQPTAQMYHVNADNAFPYRLCGGQQESGSACVSSRGAYGEVTFREWTPVAAEEYGYVVPDPLDPDIVYGGKLTRFDRRTGQAQNVLPLPFRGPEFRMIRTEPIVFSPVDNKTLYFAGNTMWKTLDGGMNWEKISPDLSRKAWPIPKSVGKFKSGVQGSQRGVIYAIAPSFQDINRIWAGTDDGLIHLTTDGGRNWRDVTPNAIGAWQKISVLEAGHFEQNTAYAAVNTLRLDDNRPHIFRTHDGGSSWQEIVKGIPDGQTVNVVREDPVRKGLLYAGTERCVYVSLDDGENWQQLRLNMPATSIRDLIVKGDDLAVGTHGRGFWILDNITPLRQFDVAANDRLYTPQNAIRVRWNLYTDTPLPPDEPAGENPPDGAAIDYYLSKAAKDVEIEIRDAAGRLVRRYRSDDKLPPVKDTNNVPAYWIRPPQPLSAGAGTHRFLWDLHYTPVAGVRTDYPISAVYRNTAPVPTSPWVQPGNYKIALRVDGKEYLQTLTVVMDPRVKTPSTGIDRQFDLSMKLYESRLKLEPISEQINSLASQLEEARKQNVSPDLLAKIDKLSAKLNDLAGAANRRPGAQLSLGVIDRIATLLDHLQEVDAAPTASVESATAETLIAAEKAIADWKKLVDIEIPEMREEFKHHNLPELKLTGLQIRYRLVGDEDDDDTDPRARP
jgi:photosystem II stability/assembly factor-like uncharacterized protein